MNKPCRRPIGPGSSFQNSVHSSSPTYHPAAGRATGRTSTWPAPTGCNDGRRSRLPCLGKRHVDPSSPPHFYWTNWTMFLGWSGGGGAGWGLPPLYIYYIYLFFSEPGKTHPAPPPPPHLASLDRKKPSAEFRFPNLPLHQPQVLHTSRERRRVLVHKLRDPAPRLGRAGH